MWRKQDYENRKEKITMNELKNKLRTLQLKKAMLLDSIESLSEVDETVFIQLGKVVAEISKIEKQIIRATENLIS